MANVAIKIGSKVKSHEWSSNTTKQLVDLLDSGEKAKEKAEQKVAAAREELDLMAAAKRKELEEKGTFTKMVVVLGSKRNACYLFKDAFKSLDIGNETKLQMALGKLYEKLLVRKKKYTVREGKIDELIAFLGDKSGDFLEKSEWIEPVDDVREKVFDMRDELSRDQIDTIDQLLGQIANRPTLSLK